MRRESAESQMIEGQSSFSLEKGRGFGKLWGLAIAQLRSSLELVAPFEELSDIENDGLEVVGGLLELTISLKQAGLVVENGRYEGPFDRLPASRSILQHFLSLIQVHACLLILVLLD